MNKDEIAEVRATAKAMREEGYQIAAGTIDRAADALTTLSAENEKLRRALREAPAALNAMAAQVEAEFRDHHQSSRQT